VYSLYFCDRYNIRHIPFQFNYLGMALYAPALALEAGNYFVTDFTSISCNILIIAENYLVKSILSQN